MNKKFKWLITENHYDVVQFLGQIIDEAIRNINI